MMSIGMSLRRRRSELSNEHGSMAMLLMVMIVGLMLSALLVPMIITQARTTRFDATRVQALNAAQTGIDVALGTIRDGITTTNGATFGDSTKLPCGPMTGVVNSNGVAAYRVVIEYFTFDPAVAKNPADATATSANEPYPSANAMTCTPGNGTYQAQPAATTPSFARFTSTGTVGTATNGSTAGRTLTATYVFRTTDTNILGGLVQIAPTGSSSLCMDAGSATPAAGAAVVLQPCSTSTPSAPQQVFAYRTDLTLQLLSSITAANPNGLCLNSASTPAQSGDAIRFAQCAALGSPNPYTEQWSYNDWGQYQAAQQDSVTTGNLPTLCMNVAAQAAGQPIILSSNCNSSFDGSWIPTPSVGPGAAKLDQWVNYNEFGRCMDVTAKDPNRNFLIDYPCKQNPYPGAKAWNQLFQAPPIPAGQISVIGQISTCTSTPATTSAGTCSASKYCLTSPGINGGYVTVANCVSGNALQTWTIYGGHSALNYSTKYTIVSGSLCLGLSAPDPSLTAWSTIDVETCTGTTEQKWNAVPNLLLSTLKNMREK